MFESLFPSHWTTLKKLMWLKLKGASAVWSTISGNPVSFTAKAAPLRKLQVAFSPVQSLNGYDAPWPAGGGKNLIHFPDTEETTYRGVTYRIENNVLYANGTCTLGFAVYGEIEANSSAAYTLSAQLFSGSIGGANNSLNVYASGDARKLLSFGASGQTESYTFTGDIATTTAPYLVINGGATFANAVIGLQVEKSASMTAFAPYSNICPISGWSSLTVEQRGKNLFFADVGHLSVNASGVVESNNSRNMLVARVEAGEKYTFSTGGSVLVGFFNDIPKLADVTYNASRININTNDPYTFTTPNGVKYIACSYADTISNQMLVKGETLPTEYVAPNPRSISISLGQTVYGGSLKLNQDGTADLVIAYKGVKGSELTWTEQTTFGGTYRANLTNLNSTGSIPTLCDSMKVCTSGAELTAAVAGIYAKNNGDYCYAKNTLTDDFVTWVADVTIVYPLAKPLTIQLTPQEVQSLAGDNTMWASSNGDLTVTYRSN